MKFETIRYIIDSETDKNNNTNVTCQCKPEYGGGPSHTTINTDKFYFRILKTLFSTDDYLSFPQFIIKGSEQIYVGTICEWYILCGYPLGPVAPSTQFGVQKYYVIVGYFMQVFYHDLCNIRGGDCYAVITIPLLWLLQPVTFVFSLLSIPVVISLVRKEATAFTLQLFQVVSSSFHMFFAADWTQNLIKYIYLCLYEQMPSYLLGAIMQYIYESLYSWTFFMCFCLMLDRFLSLWKPLKYNYYASKKKAFLIALVLLILSFIMNFDYYVNLGPFNNCCKLYFSTMRTVRGVLVFLMFIGEVVLCICFVRLVVKKTHAVSSQMKSHQNNVNFILIVSVITDSLTMFAYGVFEFCYGLVRYFIGAPSFISDSTLYNYVKIFSAVCPTFSVIFCICLSSMYRNAFLQTYCFLYYQKGRIYNFVIKHVNIKSNTVGIVSVREASRVIKGADDDTDGN